MKKNNGLADGLDGLVYTARLPLSSATLNWLADLIRGHLKKIGSRWRALPAGKIVGIVLAVLRCDQRPGDLAGGNGVHRTTVSRWVREVVGLLAARAPRLDRALKKIARSGGGMVLLDGSLIRTRRRTGTENRKTYSGKHKCHGLLVIALTSRDVVGEPLAPEGRRRSLKRVESAQTTLASLTYQTGLRERQREWRSCAPGLPVSRPARMTFPVCTGA
nr:hypothetical protein [Streptomyces montanus]